MLIVSGGRDLQVVEHSALMYDTVTTLSGIYSRVSLVVCRHLQMAVGIFM